MRTSWARRDNVRMVPKTGTHANRDSVPGHPGGMLMSTLDVVIDDIVAANRILAALAVLDGFGHVSARHPDRPDRYLLSRSLAPELVTRDDIQTYDLQSNVQDGDD